MRHHAPRRVLTLALLPLLLALLPACGDDGGKRAAGTCEATSDCGGGVCFDATCYSTCTAQDDCQTEELCVRKTEASGAAVDLCVAASDFAGCADDAGCAEVVTGSCQGARCDTETGLCGLVAFEDGVACEGEQREAGVCAAGACVVEGGCDPNCEERTCGDDGCGSSCGACEEGLACVDGDCACAPDCDGRGCGDDGCGGVCGACEEGLACVDGDCACAPDCDDRLCGDDGCGGVCGVCEEGLACVDGDCVCAPDCDDRVCGDDGCGGVCGVCEGGVPCSAFGTCGVDCLACGFEAQCLSAGFEEGEALSWTLGGDAQLVEAEGLTVAPAGQHMLRLANTQSQTGSLEIVTCVPAGTTALHFAWRLYSEEFKEFCGSAYQDNFDAVLLVPEGQLTLASRTIDDLCPPTECEGCGAHFVGLYDSDVTLDQGDVWHTAWQIVNMPIEAAITGETQTVTLRFEVGDTGDSIYDTVVLIDDLRFYTGCQPDCSAGDCADDGCGGLCGVCEPDTTCDCACAPDCSGQTCGGDGCGGSCGACDEGLLCEGGQCVVACEDACAEPGARQCDASEGGYQICDDHDDDGCLEWGAPIPCEEAQVCSNGLCAETCTNECTALGARQCSGNAYRVCGEHDDDACLEWGAPVPCDAADVCVDGVCECQPDCSDQPAGGDDGCGGTCPDAWEPPAGPGPACPDLPPVLCDGLSGACDELIQFDPAQNEGYFDALYGGVPPEDARNWASRHVVHAVQYATALVACEAAGWSHGNGGPLGLGDMSMEDGSAPSGHPSGTFQDGQDMNTAYFQDGTEDNDFRDVCDRQGQQHCMTPPHALDAWRTALFIGALHDAPDLRVIGVDGQVGLVVTEKLAWLCENGWLSNGACETAKLAYEVEDTGAGWFLFHYHRMHLSFNIWSGEMDP